MSDKPRKPGMEESEAPYKAQDDDAYVPEDAFDAYLWRNRHAINESARRAREQLARGEGYTLEETMARVKAAIQRAAKTD